MANYQGGGGGQRTYENAFFVPKTKPGKKKGKSKGNSKPSAARAKAVQNYAMPRPPANYQVPMNGNFLTEALARAGGPNQSGGTMQHQVFGQSSPYAAV